MISHDKFHKLCKYTLRMQKSLRKNNITECINYCNHLKYHVGGDGTQLDTIFGDIIKLINDKPEQYKLTNILEEKESLSVKNQTLLEEISKKDIQISEKDRQISEKDEQIEKQLKELDTKTISFTDEERKMKELDGEIKTNNGKIEKYQKIIREIKTKLSIETEDDKPVEDLDALPKKLIAGLDAIQQKLDTAEALGSELGKEKEETKTQVENLTKQISEKETLISKLDEEKKELVESNNTLKEEKDELVESNNTLKNENGILRATSETTAEQIEKLKSENYETIKKKLGDLFNSIYGEDVSKSIMDFVNKAHEKKEADERLVETKKAEEAIEERLVEESKEAKEAKAKEVRRDKINKNTDKTYGELLAMVEKKISDSKDKEVGPKYEKFKRRIKEYIENGGTEPIIGTTDLTEDRTKFKGGYGY
jgi:DNA repair exonuclease SbcCD ATPase subunit